MSDPQSSILEYLWSECSPFLCEIMIGGLILENLTDKDFFRSLLFEEAERRVGQ